LIARVLEQGDPLLDSWLDRGDRNAGAALLGDG